MAQVGAGKAVAEVILRGLRVKAALMKVSGPGCPNSCSARNKGAVLQCRGSF